jgi:hypothetical protein
MDLLKFVNENYLILVAVLYVLGAFIKNSPKIPDWTIPWILLIISMGFSVWMGGFSAAVVIQGIMVAGVAVLTNQLFKQTTAEGFLQFLNKTEVPKEIEPTNTTDFRK